MLVETHAPLEARRDLRVAIEGAGHSVRVYDPASKWDPGSSPLVIHAFADDAEDLLRATFEQGRKTILVSASSALPALPRHGHTEAGCLDRVKGWRASAYTWRHWRIGQAIDFVLRQPNEDRAQSDALALTFLGHGGSDHTRSSSAAIGTTIPIGEDEFLIGRSKQAENFGFSTSVARRHARLKRTSDEEVVVTDLGGTNGTMLNGVYIEEATMRVGDELAIAGFLRLRLTKG
jgi:hypothetical protein